MTECICRKNNLTFVQENTDHNTIDENKEGRQIIKYKKIVQFKSHQLTNQVLLIHKRSVSQKHRMN